MVVFHAEAGAITDPELATGVAATVEEVRALRHVLGVTEPLASPMSISPDTTTAFASVQFDGTTAELGRATLDALIDTAAPAETVGVQVELGGDDEPGAVTTPAEPTTTTTTGVLARP